MSINSALTSIEALLCARTITAEPDATPPVVGVVVPLDDFALSKWGKSIAVKRVFRPRTEIALAELPIILITRPDVAAGQYMGHMRPYTHTVRLYMGFHQPDREKAQEELILFEEAVEDTLLSYKKSLSFPGDTFDITPADSVNDEGRHAPVYFCVKDIEVREARSMLPL